MGISAQTVTAVACHVTQGDILVPTGNHNPPLVSAKPMATAGLIGWIDGNSLVVPGKTYHLYSNGAVLCVPSQTTCTVAIPDFNIAWYDKWGSLLEDHDLVGDQSSSIPPNADHGVVYMPHGPDPGTSDSSIMARFTYERHC